MAAIEHSPFSRISDAVVGKIASFVCQDGGFSQDHIRLFQVCKRFQALANSWKTAKYVFRFAEELTFREIPITYDRREVITLAGVQGKFFRIVPGAITMHDIAEPEKGVEFRHVSPTYWGGSSPGCALCVVDGKLVNVASQQVSFWDLRSRELTAWHRERAGNYVNPRIQNGQIGLEKNRPFEPCSIAFFDLNDGSFKEEYRCGLRGFALRNGIQVFHLPWDGGVLTVFDRETGLPCNRALFPRSPGGVHILSVSLYNRTELVIMNSSGLRVVDTQSGGYQDIPFIDEKGAPVRIHGYRCPSAFFYGHLYFCADDGGGALYIFDLKKRACVKKIPTPGETRLTAVQFVDGELIMLIDKVTPIRGGVRTMYEHEFSLRVADFRTDRTPRDPDPLPDIQGAAQPPLVTNLEIPEEEFDWADCCQRVTDCLCCFLTCLFYPFVALYRSLCTDEN